MTYHCCYRPRDGCGSCVAWSIVRVMVAYGIVALLDAIHHAQVEAIWEEFQAKIGGHGVSAVPVPHFSFHVAAGYDFEQIEAALNVLTQTLRPFRVQTNGLGLFTGTEPVLYIPVGLNSALAALHQQLWELLTPLSVAPNPYYQSHRWKPHITLAHQDMTAEQIGQAVGLLASRSFTWEIEVQQLALLTTQPIEGKHIRMMFALNG